MFKAVGYYLLRNKEKVQGDSGGTPVKVMRPDTPWRGQSPAVPHRSLWPSTLERVGVPIKK